MVGEPQEQKTVNAQEAAEEEDEEEKKDEIPVQLTMFATSSIHRSSLTNRYSLSAPGEEIGTFSTEYLHPHWDIGVFLPSNVQGRAWKINFVEGIGSVRIPSEEEYQSILNSFQVEPVPDHILLKHGVTTGVTAGRFVNPLSMGSRLIRLRLVRLRLVATQVRSAC